MKQAICVLLILLLSLPGFPALAGEADDPYALPLDITVGGFAPNPACVTADGYADESLTVRKEMITYNKVVFHVAWVTVKSPTQLRTAVAGKPNEKKINLPSRMAKARNAVLAINGEYYTQRTRDVLIYRQGVMYRNEPDPQKDVLIIDAKGDFHIFTSRDKQKEIAQYQKDGGTIVNAFSFGPALVLDGKTVTISPDYYFQGDVFKARTAIGQVGKLSYVFVRCEEPNKRSKGCTHQMMADFMGTLGIQCAYNLDGGKTSVMLLNGKYADNTSRSSEREQSDIIYVVTAVDPSKKGKE